MKPDRFKPDGLIVGIIVLAFGFLVVVWLIKGLI